MRYKTEEGWQYVCDWCGIHITGRSHKLQGRVCRACQLAGHALHVCSSACHHNLRHALHKQLPPQPSSPVDVT